MDLNLLTENGLDPNSPLLAQIQARITEQYTKQLNELTLEHKEIDERTKKITEEREVLGVNLYNTQQKLVKLQEQVDKGHDTLIMTTQIREEMERKRTEQLQIALLRRQEVDEKRKKLYKFQEELEKSQQTLKMLQNAHEKTKRDIAIKKRKTHKIEKEMEDVEKQKKHQDFRIDQMIDRIRKLKDQHQEYEELHKAQKEEYKIASETLAEATAEMEALEFEKKRLVQQWKSSIIGMQRRDEALKATEEGLRKQKEQVVEILNEIEGYKNSINEQKERHEQLTSILIKQENEQVYLEKQILDNNSSLESKQTQYMQLKNTLDKTDQEIAKEELSIQKIRKDIDVVDKKMANMSNEIRVLEENLLNLFSENTTIKKDCQNTLKDIEKKKNEVLEKEVEISQIENELARITIDKLQTQEQNKQLEQVLKELESELKQKDGLIEKYEIEIRRKNDEIEKKQNDLDKLNRLMEKILCTQQDENQGPLEATIKNITKAIEAKEKESEQLKKDWIRYQSELVKLMNRSEELSDEIKSIKSKQTILSQRKGRVDAGAIRERNQIKELTSEMQSMHKLLERLNKKISSNYLIQNSLADVNYDLENKILDRLKASEREAYSLESKIEETKNQKQAILNEMVDVERQILFWEKKIEIQKEIQEALDPTVGQEEITRMKKEIHLMEQRLADLKREQKRKIMEMEKAIEKRDLILTKGRVIQSKNTTNTKANIQREISFQQSELAKKKKKAAEAFQAIKHHQNAAEQCGRAIEEAKDRINAIKDEMTLLQEEIQTLSTQKTKIGYDRERLKKLVEKCQAILKGSFKKTPELNQELEGQKETTSKIVNIVTKLISEYPEYTQSFQVVLQE
ncbi:hypothetical protein C9374_011580 [Naegleria lovaniensis]|uniref:Coiled-coil domain-containing protein 40 n=1 Tax=Naegleria lovaniensis TaxID=51637 RepID=A0AA88GEC8_NAELO|nr:uncharacterized protein C9374_011580 [Naegleria lovaniensis]KAG2373915.1 hypothetical protein C9374_011580 [Naegleria lovaniensis]